MGGGEYSEVGAGGACVCVCVCRCAGYEDPEMEALPCEVVIGKTIIETHNCRV